MSFFLIDAISSSITILHFLSFIFSWNTIGSHVASWQYSITSSSIELVTSYKLSMLLIFLGGRGLPLLELPLKEEDKCEYEFIGDYGGVTIGSRWSLYIFSSSSRIGRKSYFLLSSTFQFNAFFLIKFNNSINHYISFIRNVKLVSFRLLIIAHKIFLLLSSNLILTWSSTYI